MEKQYKIVCDRNKWLENRISSLLREIELLRDQNSLLLEEKNAAERDANAMEGELKVMYCYLIIFVGFHYGMGLSVDPQY